MDHVLTENAPAPIGPYSQAVGYGDLVFLSGQIPLDPETGERHGDSIEEQAEQVLRNLESVLDAAG
ncbi:MAG: Rid family hydrolase, partial [Deltaproteobacteria bacterium]|nr:Rid family hydrolase [Deltaproteobacteria bacterium]